jgi:DNA sulfur modification protein DndC
MEALIDNGEEWLQPLFDVREWLAETGDPEKKRQFRDIKGRDGRVIFRRKDGTLAARTYKLEASKDALRRVLEAQKAVQESKPEADLTLISEEELHQIRRIWRTERQDWDDSVPLIYHEVYGSDLDWPEDDNTPFGSDQKRLLLNACEEYQVPFELVAKMLEAERRCTGMARRAGIQKELEKVLAEEWRSEEEIVAGRELSLELE